MTFEARYHNPHSCPSCGHFIDATTSLDGRADPADGDVSVCWYCGDFNRFVVTAFGVSLRKFTDQERSEVEADPRMAVWQEVRRKFLRGQESS